MATFFYQKYPKNTKMFVWLIFLKFLLEVQSMPLSNSGLPGKPYVTEDIPKKASMQKIGHSTIDFGKPGPCKDNPSECLQTLMTTFQVLKHLRSVGQKVEPNKQQVLKRCISEDNMEDCIESIQYYFPSKQGGSLMECLSGMPSLRCISREYVKQQHEVPREPLTKKGMLSDENPIKTDNLIKHPGNDQNKIMDKLIWELCQNDKNKFACVKNLASPDVLPYATFVSSYEKIPNTKVQGGKIVGGCDAGAAGCNNFDFKQSNAEECNGSDPANCGFLRNTRVMPSYQKANKRSLSICPPGENSIDCYNHYLTVYAELHKGGPDNYKFIGRKA